MTIGVAMIMRALPIMLCLCAPAYADDDAKTKPAPKQQPKLSRDTLKPAKPLEPLNFKSTDTGDKVQQRLELGLDKNKGLFLYGNKDTHYPLDRKPGEDYQPSLPQSTAKDSFGIGIGLKKGF